MNLQTLLWLSVGVSSYMCVLQMMTTSSDSRIRLSSPREHNRYASLLSSEDGWTFAESWSYVRCDLLPPIHITPLKNNEYDSAVQRAACDTYPSQVNSSVVVQLQSREWSSAANRTLDSAYLSVRHTRHVYYDDNDTNALDVGGHITVVHENCHVNSSYADLNADTAGYINARYGPTSLELRIIGAEMQVLPLRFIPETQYTPRHYQLLEESRHKRQSELGETTGQSRFYSLLRSQAARAAPTHVGVFCDINGTEDFGNGTMNAVTCRLHGHDRCIYENAYAVSVTGNYSLQTYLIYVDYEGVSDVPPRNRWPRAQNALVSRLDNRRIVATPQPWPRPKGYTDFLQYSPLPSPLTSDQHPLTLPHPHYFHSINDTARIELQTREVAFNGRWVHKTALHSINVSSGNVWWTIPQYPIPHGYFCTLADINDYVFVPYSFDQEFRNSLYHTQPMWGATTTTQRLNEITSTKALYQVNDNSNNHNHDINLSNMKHQLFKLYSQWTNILSKSASYLLTPLFLLPLNNSFSSPNHRTKASSFEEIYKCLGQKRIAFGGDSQTRTLARHFASILAKTTVELTKQKWQIHHNNADIQPLLWNCVIIQLNETRKPKFISAISTKDDINISNITILTKNQTQICYFPMIDINKDFILQSMNLLFDIIIINSGQHPLSYFDHMRSIPNYAISLLHHLQLDNIYNNNNHNYISNSNNNNNNKTFTEILKDRFLWWTTMPLPRALNQQMFQRSAGDGRTQQRIELANEFSVGIMLNIFNINIFDVSESIHWPFIDCAHDFAHANEPTFYTIIAELMALLQDKLKC